MRVMCRVAASPPVMDTGGLPGVTAEHFDLEYHSAA